MRLLRRRENWVRIGKSGKGKDLRDSGEDGEWEFGDLWEFGEQQLWEVQVERGESSN